MHPRSAETSHKTGAFGARSFGTFPPFAMAPKRVLITGAAGQIGYALAPQVCRGAMFGPDQEIILHLLDIPPAETALGGVAMELIDAAYPLVKGIVATVDVDEACKDVDVAVMVGGFPRGPGMGVVRSSHSVRLRMYVQIHRL